MWVRAAALLFLISSGSHAAAQQLDAREAARLDSEGKCREAEPYYRRALAAGTPSTALLNNAGNHYLVCGDPGKARAYFERLLKSLPAHQNANLQLARIAAGEKQWRNALTHLARVKEPNAPALLLRAEALHATGGSGAALHLLERLEKQAGGNAGLLRALGVLFARLGHYSRAEAAFHRVLVLHPDDFETLLNLGRAAARADHHERARTALEAALRMRPEQPDALLELGLLHAATQDYSRAVYLLAQARQKAPRPDVLLALARAAEDAGYYGDSALAYDEYLEQQPKDDTARRDRARVLGLTGTRLEEGLKEMADYIGRRPDDPVGHYNLAQFSWRTEPEKSLDQLATALRLDPNFAPAHVSRAWLLHRLGRSAQAVPHLEAALKVIPNDARALDQLGLVYLSLDRASDAETVLRRALAVAPEDPQALLHLGRALVALGREDEAKDFLEKYQRFRSRRYRDPRREPGMIESATLPAAERRLREIERFRSMSRSRPDDPLLQTHLADLLLADGAVEDAVAEFRRLLTLNADAPVWEQAGRSLLQAGQFELARNFLQKAAPTRPGARLDLATALLQTEGPGPALQAVEEIPDRERHGDFLLTKARILDAAGKSREAQELLSAGAAQPGLRPEIVQQASVLLVRYGRLQEAADLLERAGSAAPDRGELLLTRALVLALNDQREEAGNLLDTITRRWPEWDRPHLAHALLLEQLGRKREAARKLGVAAALRPQDPEAKCVLARLSAPERADPQCGCLRNLRDFLLSACSSH